MPKKFSVTWTAPANNGGAAITDYKIGITPSGGSETVTSHGGTTPPHEITGLTDGVTYGVRVRAVNAVGDGAWSPTVNQVAALLPDAPSALSLTPQTSALDLSWTAPASDGGSPVTGYSVRYTPSGGSASTVSTGSTGTTYTLSNLPGGVQHSIEVAAITAAGTGPYSTAATATPNSPVTSTTEVLLNYNNSLVDSGPTGYTFTGGINASFDGTNKQFGTHSRAFPLYESDVNSGSHWQSVFTGDFTVEMFWRYNPNVMNNSAWAAGAWGVTDNTYANNDGFSIFADAYSSNYIGWYWYLGGSGGSGTIYSTTPLIDDGTFRHIAIVRDGTEFRLYYDGSLIASNTQANNNAQLASTSHDLRVGIDPYMMGYDGTDGNIDDFRISSSALYTGSTYTIPTSELT